MSKLGNIHPEVQNILVVDDEPDILDSLKSVFELHIPNAHVHLARGGPEALAILRKGGIDVVLCDYRMPGMDGLELLTQARIMQPNVPRILITAYPELSIAVRAINDAKIENFLTKPVSPQTLLEAVNAALVKAHNAARATQSFSKAA